MNTHGPIHELSKHSATLDQVCNSRQSPNYADRRFGTLPQRCFHICWHKNIHKNQVWHLSVPLLLPTQVGQHPPVPGEQWWWADQRQQEDSGTLVMAALQKPEQTLFPTKMSPHRAAHPSSHPAPAAELLPSRTGWGSQVPPPAAAPTWASSTAAATQHIPNLPANCQALGDSENKAMHTQGFKNLTATVFLSEDIPLLQARLNYMLKFYWLQGT